MNKIFKLFFLLLAGFAISCNKGDDGDSEPLRDYTEQYTTDLDKIDGFLDTHYMTVSPDYDVVFDTILAGSGHTSVRNQTDYPLQFKMVDDTDQGIQYKVYYLNLREGTSRTPTAVDSVDVSYKGNLLNLTQFDYAQNPVWTELDKSIKGWGEILPLFKTGTYDTTQGPDPVNFTGYGAGVMFLPSGLAYYQQTLTLIPKYSPLIFSFKLYELQYKDHDRDGILSKDEVANPGDNPADYDSDGDGIANYLDVDDDDDHIMTKSEIHKNSDGSIIFEDCDGDGIPNYLDPDVCP